MEDGQIGLNGLIVQGHVPADLKYGLELAVIHHLNTVAKTVQGILLILDTVTLAHVLFTATGQHGHSGVSVARHAPMGQDFETELVAIHHLNTVAKAVWAIRLMLATVALGHAL